MEQVSLAAHPASSTPPPTYQRNNEPEQDDTRVKCEYSKAQISVGSTSGGLVLFVKSAVLNDGLGLESGAAALHRLPSIANTDISSSLRTQSHFRVDQCLLPKHCPTAPTGQSRTFF